MLVSREFPLVYDRTRVLMDRMYERGKPLAVIVLRLRPDETLGWPDVVIQGGLELTRQVLNQRLRAMPRGATPVAPAALAVVEDTWFITIPGRGAADRETDLADVLEAFMLAPWAVPGGYVARQISVGMAFWTPARVSHDPVLFLGQAFQAMVMASCGVVDALPPSVRVHSHDRVQCSVNLWEGPRRALGSAAVTPAEYDRKRTLASQVPPEVAQAQKAVMADSDDVSRWVALADACDNAGLAEQAMVARQEAARRSLPPTASTQVQETEDARPSTGPIVRTPRGRSGPGGSKGRK